MVKKGRLIVFIMEYYFPGTHLPVWAPSCLSHHHPPPCFTILTVSSLPWPSHHHPDCCITILHVASPSCLSHHHPACCITIMPVSSPSCPSRHHHARLGTIIPVLSLSPVSSPALLNISLLLCDHLPQCYPGADTGGWLGWLVTPFLHIWKKI